MPIIGILIFGLIIGLSMGGLGAGGSILMVPALVFLFGQSAHSAATISLAVVSMTSLFGAVTYARVVRWRLGIIFGLVGLATAALGTRLNRLVSEEVLLLAFACLMVLIGVSMIINERRSQHRGPGRRPESRLEDNESELAAGASGDYRSHWVRRAKLVSRVLAASAATGILTGLFGVGGGFLIVPALTLVFGFEMMAAVGTSLFIMTLNSAAAIYSRTGHIEFNWTLILPLTIAAVCGMFIGKYLNARVSTAIMNRALTTVILVVGVYSGIDAVVAL